MARLWSSGFELQSLTSGVEFTTTSNTNTRLSIDTTTKHGGLASLKLQPYLGAGNYVRQTFQSDTINTTYHRVYLYIETSTSGNAVFMELVDSANTTVMHLQLTSSDTIQVVNDENSTTVLHTTASLAKGTWHCIEFKYTDSATTTATFDLKINGITSCSLTGLTGVNAYGGIYYGAYSTTTGGTIYLDDIAINDTTGSYQNSWVGSSRIQHARPYSIGDNNAIDGASSANIALVNERTPDDNTTIINTLNDSVGDTDDYGVSYDSGVSDKIINLVSVGIRFAGGSSTAANNDTAVVRIKKVSGGTVEESAGIQPSTTSSTYRTNAVSTPRAYPLTLYDLPGASTTAWSGSDIDSMQIGLRKSADSANGFRLSTMWALIDYSNPSVSTISDDFNDNSMGSIWDSYASGGTTISETSGQVQIATTTTSGYAGYTSSLYKLTGSNVFIEVVDAGNQSLTKYEAWPLIVSANDNTKAQWLIAGGTLAAYKTVNGTSTMLGSVTYNATNHKYLRIRESSGTIYFDYSADFTTWYTLNSYTAHFNTDEVSVEISAGTWANDTSGTTLKVDNFNILPASASLVAGSVVTVDGTVLRIASASLVGGSEVTAVGSKWFNSGDIALVGGSEIYGDGLRTYSISASISGDSIVTADYAEIYNSGSITLVAGSVMIADGQIAGINDEKLYEYKIFDSAGNYTTSLTNVISDYTYNQTINTPGNAIQIELGQTADFNPATVDNIITEDTSENIDTEDSQDLLAVTASGAQVGAGGVVDLNLGIEVWVYYGYDDFLIDENGDPVVDESGNILTATVGSPDGLRLFAGYISSYSTRYGQSETTLINCLPYGAELAQYLITDGSTSTTKAFNSYDPSSGIVRGILDNFVAQGGLTTYTASTTPDSATVVSYTFKLVTSLEGIKKALELAPSNWWWAVNVGTNLLHFKPQPTDPTHTFTLGKHIKDVALTKTMENIVNTFYFLGGNTATDPDPPAYLYKKYVDTTSRTNYRQKLLRETDQRFTNEDSVDILGNSKIATNKDPRWTGQITILTKVYDIETIELGQAITFDNFGNFIDDLTLQIVGINYTPDAMTVTVDSVLPQPSKRLEDIKRNLLQTQTQEVPDTPT